MDDTTPNTKTRSTEGLDSMSEYLEKARRGGGHEYYKRTGTPGNYTYYYRDKGGKERAVPSRGAMKQEAEAKAKAKVELGKKLLGAKQGVGVGYSTAAEEARGLGLTEAEGKKVLATLVSAGKMVEVEHDPKYPMPDDRKVFYPKGGSTLTPEETEAAGGPSPKNQVIATLKAYRAGGMHEVSARQLMADSGLNQIDVAYATDAMGYTWDGDPEEDTKAMLRFDQGKGGKDEGGKLSGRIPDPSGEDRVVDAPKAGETKGTPQDNGYLTSGPKGAGSKKLMAAARKMDEARDMLGFAMNSVSSSANSSELNREIPHAEKMLAEARAQIPALEAAVANRGHDVEKERLASIVAGIDARAEQLEQAKQSAADGSADRAHSERVKSARERAEKEAESKLWKPLQRVLDVAKQAVEAGSSQQLVDHLKDYTPTQRDAIAAEASNADIGGYAAAIQDAVAQLHESSGDDAAEWQRAKDIAAGKTTIQKLNEAPVGSTVTVLRGPQKGKKITMAPDGTWRYPKGPGESNPEEGGDNASVDFIDARQADGTIGAIEPPKPTGPNADFGGEPGDPNKGISPKLTSKQSQVLKEIHGQGWIQPSKYPASVRTGLRALAKKGLAEKTPNGQGWRLTEAGKTVAVPKGTEEAKRLEIKKFAQERRDALDALGDLGMLPSDKKLRDEKAKKSLDGIDGMTEYLEKAKYKSRKRGPDGKYRYEYDDDSTRQAPAISSFGEGKPTKRSAFKVSSAAMRWWIKDTQDDGEHAVNDPTDMMFRKEMAALDAIPRQSLPKLFGADNMADAQDEIARDTKGSFRKWLGTVSKESPKVGKLLRAKPQFAGIYFYSHMKRVSGKDMADIAFKRTFETESGHPGERAKKSLDGIDGMDEYLLEENSMEKSKYTKRTGTPGNYQYEYADSSGGTARAGSAMSAKDVKESRAASSPLGKYNQAMKNLDEAKRTKSLPDQAAAAYDVINAMEAHPKLKHTGKIASLKKFAKEALAEHKGEGAANRHYSAGEAAYKRGKAALESGNLETARVQAIRVGEAATKAEKAGLPKAKYDTMLRARDALISAYHKKRQSTAEKSMNPNSILEEYLEKAQSMPKGKATMGPAKGEGSPDGGEVEGTGMTSGSNTSGGSQDAKPDEKIKKKKLSADDEELEAQLKAGEPGMDETKVSDSEGVAKSDPHAPVMGGFHGGAPHSIRQLVAREHAQAVHELRKGPADVQAAPPASPYLHTSLDDLDAEAAELAKSDSFYQGGSPTMARPRNLTEKTENCAGCGLKKSLALTACPECGHGAVTHQPMPGQALAKAFANGEQMLRPKPTPADVHYADDE